MRQYAVKNASLTVTLEKTYAESLGSPLQGILTLRPDALTFTQSPTVTRIYHRNPHVFDGRYLTVTVNDRGTVRLIPRADLATLVKHRADVEHEVALALDTLAKL